MCEVDIFINGKAYKAAAHNTVAAAILQSGETTFRTSVLGEPRAALCGMGICYECRATVDSMPHTRTCQLICQPGMQIITG